MYRSMFLPVLLTALILLVSASSPRADDQEKSKPILAADINLLLVDTSPYEKSRNGTSSFSKSQVPNIVWVQQISCLRLQLGSYVRRTINSIEYTTQLPAAPDGGYLIIEDETPFAHKQQALGSLTLCCSIPTDNRGFPRIPSNIGNYSA